MAKRAINKTRTMQIRLSEDEASFIYSKARKRKQTLTDLVLKAIEKY